MARDVYHPRGPSLFPMALKSPKFASQYMMQLITENNVLQLRQNQEEMEQMKMSWKQRLKEQEEASNVRTFT